MTLKTKVVVLVLRLAMLVDHCGPNLNFYLDIYVPQRKNPTVIDDLLIFPIAISTRPTFLLFVKCFDVQKQKKVNMFLFPS